MQEEMFDGLRGTADVCQKDSQENKNVDLSVDVGGDKRDRTADLLNAILSMLPLLRDLRGKGIEELPIQKAQPCGFTHEYESVRKLFGICSEQELGQATNINTYILY